MAAEDGGSDHSEDTMPRQRGGAVDENVPVRERRMKSNAVRTGKGDDQHFVADGWSRAYEAVEPAIRAEVEAEYADAIEKASFLRRAWLRHRMEREIRRRVLRKAPPDALY